MQITETRDFFKLKVIVSETSINEENIKIDFDGITLYSEDEDKLISIKNRRTIYDIDRCAEGLKINIFILNEGDDPEARIDWLLDEDYEIEDIFIKVSHAKNGKEFKVTINEAIGEQVSKNVPIEISPELEDTTNFILDGITEGNVSINNIVFETIKNCENLQEYIKKVMDLCL